LQTKIEELQDINQTLREKDKMKEDVIAKSRNNQTSNKILLLIFHQSITMSPNLYANSILSPAGLTLEYLQLFDLNETSRITQSNSLHQILQELINLLTSIERDLQYAISRFRLSNSVDDYRNIIFTMRTHLDSLKDKFKDQNNLVTLADLLFLQPNIISDIPNNPSGKKIIAEEYITHIADLINLIFKMCSKAAHTMTRPIKGLITSNFEMNPGIEEIEFLLVTILGLKAYLLKRIQSFYN
jgi:hypothetical protein